MAKPKSKKKKRKYSTNTELKEILIRIEGKIDGIKRDLLYGMLIAGIAFAFAVAWTSLSSAKKYQDIFSYILAIGCIILLFVLISLSARVVIKDLKKKK